MQVLVGGASLSASPGHTPCGQEGGSLPASLPPCLALSTVAQAEPRISSQPQKPAASFSPRPTHPGCQRKGGHREDLPGHPGRLPEHPLAVGPPENSGPGISSKTPTPLQHTPLLVCRKETGTGPTGLSWNYPEKWCSIGFSKIGASPSAVLLSSTVVCAEDPHLHFLLCQT